MDEGLDRSDEAITEVDGFFLMKRGDATGTRRLVSAEMGLGPQDSWYEDPASFPSVDGDFKWAVHSVSH